MIRILQYVAFIYLITGFATAQQLPHFTQYMLNDFAINPAVAGARPYYDVKSVNRYQWSGITDSPRTYTLGINGPNRAGNMGLGGFLYTDNVGPTRRTGIQLSYSYHIRIDKKINLSFGLSGGLNQFMVDVHKITLNDQTDVVLSKGVISVVVPDSKFGFFLYGKKFYLGGAVPQLFKNTLEFDQNTNSLSKLEGHYFLTGAYRLKAATGIAIVPSFMMKIISPVPMQIDLTVRAILKDKFWFGLSYRNRDAVNFMMGFLHNERLTVGYSYDLTTTNLGNYTTGSHELVLGIKFISVTSTAHRKIPGSLILQ